MAEPLFFLLDTCKNQGTGTLLNIIFPAPVQFLEKYIGSGFDVDIACIAYITTVLVTSTIVA